MTPWAFVDLDKFIVFGFRGSVFTCSLQIRSEKFQSFFKKNYSEPDCANGWHGGEREIDCGEIALAIAQRNERSLRLLSAPPVCLGE
jgi:hypothetical protein